MTVKNEFGKLRSVLLCKPVHFALQPINVIAEGFIRQGALPSQDKVLREHEGFAQALAEAGVEIVWADPDPDLAYQVFTRDVGVMTPRGVLLGTFYEDVRHGEETRAEMALNGHVPIIYTELVKGDSLKLTAMPKGGGSTNIAAHGMLKPGVGLKGIKEFVLKSIAKAGALGCPPYLVGVGIGGGEDVCMTLAKKALLKPFRERSMDPKMATMEEELYSKVNRLGIGAMGLGEGPTLLDIHIEVAARHPASLPVGVVISCWALRHSEAVISANGDVEYH